MFPQAHHDPVVPVLLGLSLIIFVAKLGAILAHKLRQPEVLGELVMGIIVGNLILFNFDLFYKYSQDPVMQIFSGLGVIILLFWVGLESNLKDMMAVGWQSSLVAIVGVVIPFVLGYWLAEFLYPELSFASKIFAGAILTATSVGISARVFEDLNVLQTKEARIVLGAAVIDDVLGLVILAVVTALATEGSIDLGSIAWISAKSVGFVVAAITIGIFLAHKVIKLASIFRLPGMMLSVALVICFLGAYWADQVGLATIVGAFAMGLILDNLSFKAFNSETNIETYIRPLYYFFVPIFFVITGMKVDLSVFMDQSVIYAALLMSAAAIIGKLVCGWAFSSKEKLNRWIIAVGMVPRGEVGLIFASVGSAIGVIDERLYAITVIMVIITTLIPPVILNALINKSGIK